MHTLGEKILGWGVTYMINRMNLPFIFKHENLIFHIPWCIDIRLNRFQGRRGCGVIIGVRNGEGFAARRDPTRFVLGFYIGKI